MRSLAVILAPLCGALALAAPSHADDDGETRSRAVEYRTAELATQAGRVELETRLETAARRVCRDHARRDLAARAAEIACVEQAVAEAVARLDRRHFASNAAFGASSASSIQ